MDVPERNMEDLFAIDSGPEGVAKNGDVCFISDCGVFYDFRRYMGDEKWPFKSNFVPSTDVKEFGVYAEDLTALRQKND